MSLYYVIQKKENRIDSSQPGKYYLIQKSLGQIGKKGLIEDMVKHTSTTRQEAQSAIEYLFEALPRLIQLGYTVHYEGVGYFCTSIQSEGCAVPEEANAFKKKAVKLHFRPCKKLRENINAIPIHPFPVVKSNAEKESALKHKRIENRESIEKNKSIQIAKRSLDKGLGVELIAELTGLTEDEIKNL